jgi:hypothetical protein
MKEIDTEKKRQRSEAQLLLGWLKMLPQSELEPLSRCPAEKWVPALLEGVWTRVLAALQTSEKPRGPS